MLSLADLAERIKKAKKQLSDCRLCPQECGVDRVLGERGFCRSGENPRVYSFFPHYGEEPVLSGFMGSGTIFFSNCTLRCVYCQNYQISQQGEGEDVSTEKLAMLMLSLANEGVHNLNLVSPTHFLPQLLRAVSLAVRAGFQLPIVYNSSGYEKVESLQLLDGVVDIYLVDMRYGDNESAKKYSKVKDYVEINQAAVKEMHQQVGELQVNEGLAEKGVLVRHLVLPEDLSGTEKVCKFISEEISPDTYISLMSQYHPVYRANEFPEINRRITYKEYQHARKALKKYDLKNGWWQAPPISEENPEFLGVNFKPKGA